MQVRPVLRHLWQSNLRTDDLSDKLNSTWTVLFLFFSSYLAWYYTFVSDPITCWAPAQFPPASVNYMHKVCWDAEGYYDLLDDAIPKVPHYRIEKWKPVYKWLPLILFLQALLFKLPDIILSAGQSLFGFNFKKILALTDGYTTLNMTDRVLLARQIGRYVKNWLRSSTIRAIPWGPLTLVYLLVKILYVINILTQISYLERFLRVENETSYGQMMADDITSNVTSKWRAYDRKFPKIVLCDFRIRQLQTVQYYTVQCKLNFGTFYEGMFVVIWIWFVFTSVATCVSTMLYLLKVLIPIFRKRFVELHVKLSEELTHEPADGEISQFVSDELNEDGIMILKAIGEVSSELLVKDIIIYLWTSRYQTSGMPMSSTSAPPYNTGYNPVTSGGRGGVIIAPPPSQTTSGAQGESIPLVQQTTDKTQY